MIIETIEIKLEQLIEYCSFLHAKQAVLLTLWGSDERDSQAAFKLHLLFLHENKVLHYQIQLEEIRPSFPDLSYLFPVANRLQRALYDLLGIRAIGALDQRSWLRHQAWSAEQFPLRSDFYADECQQTDEIYPFIKVKGAGVHEIPVGPVHAGVIEPGHFRFSVIGERILKLEERLGYTHKGIIKQLQGLTISSAAKIVARVSGDATVAYSVAFAQAIEKLMQKPQHNSALSHAFLLERERIANHLGDLGALGNDGGLAFGLAQFSRLKEEWLRTQAELFGHRYMMDHIAPGEDNIHFIMTHQQVLLAEITRIRKEVVQLHMIYQQHSGLQNRFMTTGRVTLDLAKQLGLLGFAARASGVGIDFRSLVKSYPYSDFPIKMVTQKQGDVAARVEVRFQEIFHSLEFLEKILRNPPESNSFNSSTMSPTAQVWSIGMVESWRGPVIVAIKLDEQQRVVQAHIHDSSWQNWPAIEYAVMGNIVADFPLINKSFNLSYSGHDV